MKLFTNIKKVAGAAVLVVTAIVVAAQPAMPALAAVVTSPAPAAKISFTFDDGLANSLNQAAPTLAQYGLVGTNYITTGCVGTVGTCAADPDEQYMTWAQIETLRSQYGWEIGSHTVSHPQLATDNLSDTELDRQLRESKETLAAHGIDAKNFATPFGDYDNRALAVVAKYYQSHRGFWDVDNNVWSYNDYLLNNMQVQKGVSVAAVKARIDQAIASNNWLILTFHGIKANPSTDPEEYEYSTAELAEIAAYVKTKQTANALKNVTISQGLVTSDTNLLGNNSFESGLNNGWSTNTPTTATLDTGKHGAYPSPTNAVSLSAGSTNTHLFSPMVNVTNTDSYMLKSFLNMDQYTSGEMGYYIDEYNAAGQWISGQWMGAQTAKTTRNVNFTYKPSSSSVKKASLQVYVDANTGIHAYVDNFQWFSLTGTDTPVPPTNSVNLLTNSAFDQGIAGGWTTDNATAFTANNQNNGATASPVNSIKMTAQSSNAQLYAPKASVSADKTYTVNGYINMQARTTGEFGIYIDEYNASGAWISGQYVYSKKTVGAETFSFDYVPSSANVAKAGLQYIVTGGSGITGYLDELKLLAPAGTTAPDPIPTPTNLVANGTFDAGIADGWTTNSPTSITADTANNGSPANATNSVRLTATTQERHLFSPQVTVVNGKSYSITSYLNLQQITSGEIGFYIDEYDANGNWISGQWKTARSAAAAGDVAMSYTPSSANVAKASMQVYVMANSGITAYLDDVRWFQN